MTGERQGQKGDTIWEMECDVEHTDGEGVRRFRVGVVLEQDRLVVVTTMWRPR